MNSPSGQPPGSGDAEALLENLAVFLKASAVYPSDHPRVLGRADECLSRLRPWLNPLAWLRVRLRGDTMLVGESEVASTSSLVTWLRDQLRSASLAGIEIGAGVDGETLTQFADALRRCNRASRQSFADLWPVGHTSVRALDLVFDGEHDEVGEQSGWSDFEGGHRLTGAAAQDVWKNKHVRKLTMDEGVGSKLLAIERCLLREADDTEQRTQVGLLDQIVGLLPLEVLHEEGRVKVVVDQVLEMIEASLLSRVRDEGLASEALLTRSALAVARKYFENFNAQAVVLDPTLPAGRPEDEPITDDLELLLEDIEKLPAAGTLKMPSQTDLSGESPRVAAELAGIYLYILANAEKKETIRALEPCLRRCFADPTPGQMHILETYFRKLKDLPPGTAPDANSLRLLGSFQRVGLAELLIGEGYLPPEVIASTFPAFLVGFVGGLTNKPSDVQRLHQALAAVGEQRMQLGLDLLKREGDLDDRAFVDKVLTLGGEHARQIAMAVVSLDHEWARARTALYLRNFDLPAAEAAALRGVDPPGRLPASYLSDLCRLIGTKEPDPALAAASAEVLRKFVAETVRRDQVDRRIAAIRSLRYLPHPETEQLLERIRLEGRFFRWTASARAVRHAAAETLLSLEARK